MNRKLSAQPLTASLFTRYGDVIETGPQPTVVINQGNCARYSDLAAMEFVDARAGISVFQARPYSVPHTLNMMERHPLGSQAFIPMTDDAFLVIVAEDDNGVPGLPQAFLSSGRQGVNYQRNTWHGVLTPLSGSGLFSVIDRIGEGDNLQEHWFETPWQIDIE